MKPTSVMRLHEIINRSIMLGGYHGNIMGLEFVWLQRRDSSWFNQQNMTWHAFAQRAGWVRMGATTSIIFHHPRVKNMEHGWTQVFQWVPYWASWPQDLFQPGAAAGKKRLEEAAGSWNRGASCHVSWWIPVYVTYIHIYNNYNHIYIWYVYAHISTYNNMHVCRRMQYILRFNMI